MPTAATRRRPPQAGRGPARCAPAGCAGAADRLSGQRIALFRHPHHRPRGRRRAGLPVGAGCGGRRARALPWHGQHQCRGRQDPECAGRTRLCDLARGGRAAGPAGRATAPDPGAGPGTLRCSTKGAFLICRPFGIL